MGLAASLGTRADVSAVIGGSHRIHVIAGQPREGGCASLVIKVIF